ncbi:MAG: hypothetical protein ABIP51_10560 [Bacteroidia bacterium]
MKLKSLSAILISVGSSFIYSFLLNSQFNQQSSVWWHSLLFFIALFIVLNLVYFIRTDGKPYAGILLGSSIAKFISSLVFIIIYLFTLKGGFLAFFLHFIGHYVLFTVFEMRYLLQLIKTKSK